MSVVKKAVKGVGKWVRKNWVKLVVAAAVVFTCGIATVGVAGFSAASAAAGGGFAGFVSAAGSTMAAGVASIGGTLGIGQGANLAAFGGTGYATLGTGAAAQSLGLAGANGAMTAGRIASMGTGAPSAALGGGPAAALASNAGSAASTAGGVTSVAPAAASAATGAAPVAGGGFLSRNAVPLMQAGLGLIQSYGQARQAEEDWERTKPRGYWGVGLNGEEDAQITPQDPRAMWDASSFQNPNAANTQNVARVGLMGNRALDAQRRVNPNITNPLSQDFDPALARINRGAVYG